MIDLDTTVGEILELAEEMNAASTKLVLSNKDEDPYQAIVVLQGEPETEEALEVLDDLEESWHEDS